jgi:hypothetical protein
VSLYLGGNTKAAQVYASGPIQKILFILPILFRNEKQDGQDEQDKKKAIRALFL